MEDIKAYKPQSNSIGSGQVLPCPYSFEKARLVVREMADSVALELVDKGLVTDQMVLTVGYDRENLEDGGRKYKGAVTTDRYGRKIPKHGHGTANLENPTSSARLITATVVELFDTVVSRELLIRRIYLTACRVTDEALAASASMEKAEQLDMFTDYEALERERREEEVRLDREKRMQKAMVDIKKKFGKNAILKGMNLMDGATAKERNRQIGGHKA